MQRLKDFFTKYNISTHSVFVAWTTIMTFYWTNPEAHKYINDTAYAIYHKLPSWLAEFIVSFAVPFGVWYWNGRKKNSASPQEEPLKLTTPSSVSGPSKLGALILCCLLITGVTLPTSGCNSNDVGKIVQDVGVYVQEAMPIVANVLSILQAYGLGGKDPTYNSLDALGDQINTDLQQLGRLVNDYQSHPQKSTFAQITQIVDSVVANADTSLLQAAHISNPDSQRGTVTVLASLSAILHIIDGIVTTQLPSNQVKARASARAARLKQISQYWSSEDKARISNAFHTPYPVVLKHALSAGF